VRTVVLDEADRPLDESFEADLATIFKVRSLSRLETQTGGQKLPPPSRRG
jgi:superfamily II DNA/RNA helicase